MKKLWLLLAIAVPLQSIHAQVEHAPAVDECRAAYNRSFLRLLSLNQQEAALAKIGYLELLDLHDEMRKCEGVDRERELDYCAETEELDGLALLRLKRFLDRHNLYAQFLARTHKASAELCAANWSAKIRSRR